jgi:hypothetical protein
MDVKENTHFVFEIVGNKHLLRAAQPGAELAAGYLGPNRYMSDTPHPSPIRSALEEIEYFGPRFIPFGSALAYLNAAAAIEVELLKKKQTVGAQS